MAAAAPARALDLVVALALGVGAFALYRLTTGPAVGQQSGAPHFVLLAWAFLHGHLWVDPLRAARLGDITPYAGRYYVSFPPMPALLLLPFVAAAGPAFDDRLFSLALGGANVALAYLLVRRLRRPGFAGKGVPVGWPEAVAAAILLGFGSVHFYAVASGAVWYLAHVVCVLFLLLYLLECAGRGRPLVAGVALACAFLARAPALLGLLLWLILALRQPGGLRALAAQALPVAAPLALAVAFLLWQNQARFGSLADFGYYKMRVAGELAPRFRAHGQFSAAFLPDNLAALLTLPPLVQPAALPRWLGGSGGLPGLWRLLTMPGARSAGAFPIQFNPWGTGLWAVSPALAPALRPPGREHRWLFAASWLTAAAVLLPDLLYYNTGWYQYGDRFLLDALPFLLVALALGLRRPLSWRWRAIFALLLLVSIASNWLGTRWFLHLPPCG